jgi:hypothetical protein
LVGVGGWVLVSRLYHLFDDVVDGFFRQCHLGTPQRETC